MRATFERPVEATLIVRGDNGDEWEATEDDLRKFGYVDHMMWAKGENELDRRLGVDLREESDLAGLVLSVIPWLAGYYGEEEKEHPEIAEDVHKIRALIQTETDPVVEELVEALERAGDVIDAARKVNEQQGSCRVEAFSELVQSLRKYDGQGDDG